MFRQQYTSQNTSKLEQRATAKKQANRLMQENMFRQQYTVQNSSKLEQRDIASNKPTG